MTIGPPGNANISTRRSASKKLVEWTGNIAFTGFTAPKVLWVRANEPENFSRIAKIMLPKDYLAYKMSGVFAPMSRITAHTVL
jgi:sugar (pentulose or hexulose) kinase